MIIGNSKQEFWADGMKQLIGINTTLLNNIKFIYELLLMQLELRTLGINFIATDGLGKFKINIESDELNEKLIKRTAYLKSVGEKLTDYSRIVQKNQTKSESMYLTHGFYPYKGKFHPQMIRALLNIIGLNQADTVLDPFIGSGTTALEAQLLGINCIGIDISPLCVLLSKVKVESMDVLTDIINWEGRIKNTIILDETIESISNEKVRNFYKIVKLTTISDNVRRGKNFSSTFLKNLKRILSSIIDYYQIVKELNLQLGKTDIKIGDARKLPLDTESIDGIITSPPYSIALDYITNDAHALKDLELNLLEIKEKCIGVRGKGCNRIELYNEDMKQSYTEMYRVLKSQKFAVIIVGNATFQKEKIKTVEFTIEYMEKIGFKMIKNINKFIFGLYNTMKKENILIFQK
jgi:DNA modification methylase